MDNNEWYTSQWKPGLSMSYSDYPYSVVNVSVARVTTTLHADRLHLQICSFSTILFFTLKIQKLGELVLFTSAANLDFTSLLRSPPL